ncbi:hypothetical protein [Streptomyces luteogriseus]
MVEQIPDATGNRRIESHLLLWPHQVDRRDSIMVGDALWELPEAD